MVWLIVFFIFYIATVIFSHRRQSRLMLFVTGAFGLAFLIIQFAVMFNIHVRLAELEALQIKTLLSTINVQTNILNGNTLTVPDQSGWVGMIIGVESSTIIEIAVFVGVILFYPKLNLKQRGLSLVVGVVGTYLLNLVRLLIIVASVMLFDRRVFPLAHNIVGRIIYFSGVITLYWYLLTRPTLNIVRNNLIATQEAST